jgi:hypothetical protein
MVVFQGWKLHHRDVKTTFFNNKREEEIYMKQMFGFVQWSQEHLVCKLHKALNGLK